MGGVFAGDVTLVAFDARLGIDPRHHRIVEVEIVPVDKARHGLTDELARRDPATIEIIREPFDHVGDDAKAVMHDRRANLHVGRAHEHELNRVAPIGDAPDSGDRHADRRIARARADHVERDRLDGGAAEAAVRRVAVDVRDRQPRVEVDADERVDRVDHADRVGAAGDRRAGRVAHVGDVGGQLHDHRNVRGLFDPARDLGDEFGILTDGGALPALRHPMRAAEVELDAVDRHRLHCAYELVPALARALGHERGDDRAVGIGRFAFGDLAQVDVERPIADELDVVHPDHPVRARIEPAEARGDVDDRFEADCLPHRAAPTGGERAHHLIAGVRRRRRREPKRVGAADTGEVDREIGHQRALSRK